MNKIEEAIGVIDLAICKNIEQFNISGRGYVSQNILKYLRDYVEHIALRILQESKNDVEIDQKNIKAAIHFVQANGKYNFLARFHKLLQISVSHYTLNEENSERLMLKYYEYLVKIKFFLKQEYDFSALHNLNKFEVYSDSSLKEYYKKISILIGQPETSRKKIAYKDRCYIEKCKPFFVNGKVYYEVTFKRANDYASKFDRIIAFTEHEILDNYAVKLSISTDYIEVLNKKMPVQIIDDWQVSIRPCELNNFAKIVGLKYKISQGADAFELMKYLTETKSNLIELIDLNDYYYEYIKDSIVKKSKSSRVFNLLDTCRNLCKEKKPGYVVLRYLLLRLNNKIIKKQYSNGACSKLSDLYLQYGCIPFDTMPFNSSLINHNPKIFDLLLSIESQNRKHELLARHVKNNTEQKGQLYTPIDELENFGNPEQLILNWNNNLYKTHTDRSLDIFKNYAFIRKYQSDTIKIINSLRGCH